MTQDTLNQAYVYCQQVASQHYENFPVASILLPKSLRRPISAIYAFARTADDFADEGDFSQEQRLNLLEGYQQQLNHITTSKPIDGLIFIALQDTIQQYQLPTGLFTDLLTAFKQDVTKKRYSNFNEVLEYCTYSANPIGRLLLYLFNQSSRQNLLLSDNICSSLQIINFLQDIEQDYIENNRIYLPQDEMEDFHVNESMIREKKSSQALQKFFSYQINRAEMMLVEGSSLGVQLPGRLGLEIRVIIQGGLSIIKKLKHHQGDIFRRPRLTNRDKLNMFWNAVRKKPVSL